MMCCAATKGPSLCIIFTNVSTEMHEGACFLTSSGRKYRYISMSDLTCLLPLYRVKEF